MRPRARAWQWLPHVRPTIVLAVSFGPLSRYTYRCGPAACPDDCSGSRFLDVRRNLLAPHNPCLYMTVLVSDGSASDKRGGALMVLRSYLADVAEITGARGGLPGFLDGG